MDTNIISKYNKKYTIATALFITMFFVLVSYGEAVTPTCTIFRADDVPGCADPKNLVDIAKYNEIAGKAFPNGNIIKSNTNPKVYYLEDFKKRPIESPAIVESRGLKWNSLIVTSREDIESIPDGEQLKFRDGALLSNRGGVYIISNGLRRPIVSPAAFLRLGFKWNNIKAVSDAELNLHPLGEAVTTTSNYPDGVVIKTGSGKMYLVEDDKRRYIPSPLVFESRFKWNETVDLSLAVAPVYNPNPKGDVTIRDGVLISGEGKVWFTESGKKVPIYSPEIFESLGLNWGQIKVASSFDMNNIPTNNLSNIGKNVRVPALYTLVKSQNSSQIYVFEGNIIRPVNSLDILTSYAFRPEHVITIPDRLIKQYSIGSPIPVNR